MASTTCRRGGSPSGSLRAWSAGSDPSVGVTSKEGRLRAVDWDSKPGKKSQLSHFKPIYSPYFFYFLVNPFCFMFL